MSRIVCFALALAAASAAAPTWTCQGGHYINTDPRAGYAKNGVDKASLQNCDGETYINCKCRRCPANFVANGLTTSGQNLPFALPQRVDALETGFSMAFLQSDPNGEPGTFVSVGEIVASVEDVDGGARALIVRGTGKAAEKGVLVDVPMVMNTMVPAIKNAIAMSSQ